MLCRRQQKKTISDCSFILKKIIQNVLSICPNGIILFIKAIQQIHTKVKKIFIAKQPLIMEPTLFIQFFESSSQKTYKWIYLVS